MLSMFRRLARDDRGVTAIEYTLIACLISVAAILALTSVGTKISGIMSNIATTL
jgi:pilus assembly protein Flp/PilA